MATSCSETSATRRRSRKRRRYFCGNHTTTDTITRPRSSSARSFMMVFLMAACAAMVQGDSRTLRHRRLNQQKNTHAILDPTTNRSILAPGIKEEQYPQRALHEFGNKGGNEVHYGIGQQHPSRERITEAPLTPPRVATKTVRKSGAKRTENKSNNTVESDNDSGLDNDDDGGGPLTVHTFTKQKGASHNYGIGNDLNKQQVFTGFNRQEYKSLPRTRDEPPDFDVMNDGTICQYPYEECCGIDDCKNGGDICVNRNCIDDGHFRFTLQWIGDDDYDLFVVTPDGAEISYSNPTDPASLGKLGEEMVQEIYGHHVENIYFPVEGGPTGVYRFYVRPFFTVGTSDEWTITVVLDGEVVVTESGFGASDSFYCRKDPSPPTLYPTISPISLSPTQSPVKTGAPTVALPAPTIVTPVEHPNRPPLGQEPEPVPTPKPVPVPTKQPEPVSTPKPVPVPVPTKQPEPVPTPKPVPVPVPTEPPNTLTSLPIAINETCNLTSGDECCVLSDCQNPEEVCEQRTCIKDGNPRFTLIWNGDEDLHLFVITPDGVEISADNTFDVFSGGTYERGNTDKVQLLGYHVENIYFSSGESPSGTYKYLVRSSTGRSIDKDSWSVEIHDGGELVHQENGSGDSVTFTYFRPKDVNGPQRPDQDASRCSLEEEECCIDADCANVSGDICIQRTCISEGSLRISLEWTGDDDLLLTVKTPEDVVISQGSDFDAGSGGRYEGSKQSTFGFHVENVYFPKSGAPSGTYLINVDSSSVNGVGNDIWTVRIYENGKKLFEEVGFGGSGAFSYKTAAQPVVPTLAPIPAPVILPTGPSVSCTTDSDCLDGAQVCVGEVCINEGSPRFTLQWPGESLYSLTVVTPGGTYISAFSPFDPDSGGIFEGPTQQRISGDDVESIYFPMEKGPLGLYTYYVTNSVVASSDETWTVTVSVNGENLMTKTGSGKSDEFTFQFIEAVEDKEAEIAQGRQRSPVPAPQDQKECDQLKAECCTNTDCSSDEMCSFDICVKKGAPQFLLSWEGNYDVALAIVTPLGTAISWEYPLDADSGGIFEDHAYSEENRRIENIYFAPDEGPLGVYPYYIHSYQTGSDDANWTLGIYVDGEEVSTESGKGSSEVLFFDYKGLVLDGQQGSEEEVCDPLALPEGQCCSSIDCFPNEACTSRTCVDEGNPRFTLSWEGENDLDLVVVTPLGGVISSLNLEDPESGGKFGEDFDQFESGLHAENVYFPMDGGPVGEYSIYVRSFLSSNGVDDEWTVGVYVKGEEQLSVSGSGTSEQITYTFFPLVSYAG